MGKSLTARIGERTDKGTLITQSIVDQNQAISDELVVIADNTEQIIAAMGNAIAIALEAIGIEAEGDAFDLCPVDTGRLRNSITHTIDADDRAAVVGTNVEYALYVHEGVHGKKGQPFLTDAVTQNAGKYRAIAEKMLKNA